MWLVKAIAIGLGVWMFMVGFMAALLGVCCGCGG